MSSLPQPQSSLREFLVVSRQRVQPETPGVELSERPFLGHLNLRGEAGDPEFLQGVERCLRIRLPLQPNTFAENDRVAILWLAPDEWLLITGPGSQGDMARELRVALQGMVSAVTDVTHGQTIVSIRGDRTLDVLRKGCSLDLHPAVFGAGCCAQTLLAKTGVIIRWVDRSPALDLIVRRSFAEYLALWLTDAAEEYSVAVS